MKTIYKYHIPTEREPTVYMPQGADILSVHAQGDMIFCWAIVDPQAPMVATGFRVYGTGDTVDDGCRDLFIGTVRLYDYKLVFHVFERK